MGEERYRCCDDGCFGGCDTGRCIGCVFLNKWLESLRVPPVRPFDTKMCSSGRSDRGRHRSGWNRWENVNVGLISPEDTSVYR